MSDCVPITLLLAALAHGRALEARVAELSRPKHPADFGLVGVGLTPTETRLVMALLPPGEALHRDAITARVWPDIAAAGLVEESAHMVRVQISRVRAALHRSGWTIHIRHGHSEYVLLKPGMALPDGWRDGRLAAQYPDARRRPCPECDGTMSHSARMCLDCSRRSKAAAAHGGQASRPPCAGRKWKTSRLCAGCDMKRRQFNLPGWVAA